MNPKINLDKLQQIEEAIIKKYGVEATIDPRQFWNDEKEKKYQEQINDFLQKRNQKDEEEEKIEENGFLISKTLFKHKNEEEQKEECQICHKTLFNFRDKIYLIKFKACYECYILHIEGREEKYSFQSKNDK